MGELNGFLIPDKVKCDRQIGMQSIDADIVHMPVYNRAKKCHESRKFTHEQMEKMLHPFKDKGD